MSRLSRANNRKMSTLNFLQQHREPNYDKVQTIYKLVATDVASIETTRGGGRHSYQVIVIMADAACHTLTGETFIPPTSPGPNTTIEGVIAPAEMAT